jgi:hypothetical protein
VIEPLNHTLDPTLIQDDKDEVVCEDRVGGVVGGGEEGDAEVVGDVWVADAEDGEEWDVAEEAEEAEAFFCSDDLAPLVEVAGEELVETELGDRVPLGDVEEYTATITPAPSLPGVHGKVGRRAYFPDLIYVSTGFTPHACTRTNTCPGCNLGIGTDCNCKTSGPPNEETRMAFIVAGNDDIGASG